MPLQQVTYCLTVLIVLCTVNATLHNWVYTSSRHFLLTEASFLTVSLSLGFLSYYIFSLPGHKDTEFFVIVMILLLNVGLFGLCVGCFAGDWLKAKKVDTCPSISQVPPNTSSDPSELSSRVQMSSS